MHEVVNIKYVFSNDGDDPAAPWHYPYDEDFSRFISAAVPLLYGSGLDRYQSLGTLAATRRFRERVRKLELLRNARKLL